MRRRCRAGAASTKRDGSPTCSAGYRVQGAGTGRRSGWSDEECIEPQRTVAGRRCSGAAAVTSLAARGSGNGSGNRLWCGRSPIQLGLASYTFRNFTTGAADRVHEGIEPLGPESQGREGSSADGSGGRGAGAGGLQSRRHPPACGRNHLAGHGYGRRHARQI